MFALQRGVSCELSAVRSLILRGLAFGVNSPGLVSIIRPRACGQPPNSPVESLPQKQQLFRFFFFICSTHHSEPSLSASLPSPPATGLVFFWCVFVCTGVYWGWRSEFHLKRHGATTTNKANLWCVTVWGFHSCVCLQMICLVTPAPPQNPPSSERTG